MTSGLIQMRRWSVCVWLLLLPAWNLAQGMTAVSARFAAVHGAVKFSPPDGNEQQAHKGDSIRAGTVIETSAESGALLKPLPSLRMVIQRESKVRFDGANIGPDGTGHVTCSILAGRVLFRIDPSMGGPRVKVTVLTEEGVITTHGGASQHGGGKNPVLKGDAAAPSEATTWTVQHEQGRTVVAVDEGTSHVSVAKNDASQGGNAEGEVEVPQGSVIWLFNRGGGKVDAEIVDTLTGRVLDPAGRTLTGRADLVQLSRKQLVTPSSEGTTTELLGPPPGVLPPGPTNPDLSSPRPVLPVVSADTP